MAKGITDDEEKEIMISILAVQSELSNKESFAAKMLDTPAQLMIKNSHTEEKELTSTLRSYITFLNSPYRLPANMDSRAAIQGIREIARTNSIPQSLQEELLHSLFNKLKNGTREERLAIYGAIGEITSHNNISQYVLNATFITLLDSYILVPELLTEPDLIWTLRNVIEKRGHELDYSQFESLTAKLILDLKTSRDDSKRIAAASALGVMVELGLLPANRYTDTRLTLRGIIEDEKGSRVVKTAAIWGIWRLAVHNQIPGGEIDIIVNDLIKLIKQGSDNEYQLALISLSNMAELGIIPNYLIVDINNAMFNRLAFLNTRRDIDETLSGIVRVNGSANASITTVIGATFYKFTELLSDFNTNTYIRSSIPQVFSAIVERRATLEVGQISMGDILKVISSLEKSASTDSDLTVRRNVILSLGRIYRAREDTLSVAPDGTSYLIAGVKFLKELKDPQTSGEVIIALGDIAKIYPEQVMLTGLVKINDFKISSEDDTKIYQAKLYTLWRLATTHIVAEEDITYVIGELRKALLNKDFSTLIAIDGLGWLGYAGAIPETDLSVIIEEIIKGSNSMPRQVFPEVRGELERRYFEYSVPAYLRGVVMIEDAVTANALMHILVNPKNKINEEALIAVINTGLQNDSIKHSLSRALTWTVYTALTDVNTKQDIIENIIRLALADLKNSQVDIGQKRQNILLVVNTIKGRELSGSLQALVLEALADYIADPIVGKEIIKPIVDLATRPTTSLNVLRGFIIKLDMLSNIHNNDKAMLERINKIKSDITNTRADLKSTAPLYKRKFFGPSGTFGATQLWTMYGVLRGSLEYNLAKWTDSYIDATSGLLIIGLNNTFTYKSDLNPYVGLKNLAVMIDPQDTKGTFLDSIISGNDAQLNRLITILKEAQNDVTLVLSPDLGRPQQTLAFVRYVNKTISELGAKDKIHIALAVPADISEKTLEAILNKEDISLISEIYIFGKQYGAESQIGYLTPYELFGTTYQKVGSLGKPISLVLPAGKELKYDSSWIEQLKSELSPGGRLSQYTKGVYHYGSPDELFLHRESSQKALQKTIAAIGEKKLSEFTKFYNNTIGLAKQGIEELNLEKVSKGLWVNTPLVLKLLFGLPIYIFLILIFNKFIQAKRLKLRFYQEISGEIKDRISFSAAFSAYNFRIVCAISAIIMATLVILGTSISQVELWQDRFIASVTPICSITDIGKITPSVTPEEVADSSLVKEMTMVNWNGLVRLISEKGLVFDKGTIDINKIIIGNLNGNISAVGSYLAAVVSARDMGIISDEEARIRIMQTLKIFETLPKDKNGFFYSWYDAQTGKPQATTGNAMVNRELQQVTGYHVSSLDNGLLDLALEGLREAYKNDKEITKIIDNLLGHNYAAFYDTEKQMMSIGYFDVLGELYYETAHYSNWGSEARAVVAYAEARGDLPKGTFANLKASISSYKQILITTFFQGSSHQVFVPEIFIGESRMSAQARAILLNYSAIMLDKDIFTGAAESPIGYIANAGIKEVSQNDVREDLLVPYALWLAGSVNPKMVARLNQLRSDHPEMFSAQFGFVDSMVTKDGDLGRAGTVTRKILAVDHAWSIMGAYSAIDEDGGFSKYVRQSGVGEKIAALYSGMDNQPQEVIPTIQWVMGRVRLVITCTAILIAVIPVFILTLLLRRSKAKSLKQSAQVVPPTLLTPPPPSQPGTVTAWPGQVPQVVPLAVLGARPPPLRDLSLLPREKVARAIVQTSGISIDDINFDSIRLKYESQAGGRVYEAKTKKGKFIVEIIPRSDKNKFSYNNILFADGEYIIVEKKTFITTEPVGIYVSLRPIKGISEIGGVPQTEEDRRKTYLKNLWNFIGEQLSTTKTDTIVFNLEDITETEYISNIALIPVSRGFSLRAENQRSNTELPVQVVYSRNASNAKGIAFTELYDIKTLAQDADDRESKSLIPETVKITPKVIPQAEIEKGDMLERISKIVNTIRQGRYFYGGEDLKKATTPFYYFKEVKKGSFLLQKLPLIRDLGVTLGVSILLAVGLNFLFISPFLSLGFILKIVGIGFGLAVGIRALSTRYLDGVKFGLTVVVFTAGSLLLSVPAAVFLAIGSIGLVSLVKYLLDKKAGLPLLAKLLPVAITGLLASFNIIPFFSVNLVFSALAVSYAIYKFKEKGITGVTVPLVLATLSLALLKSGVTSLAMIKIASLIGVGTTTILTGGLIPAFMVTGLLLGGIMLLVPVLLGSTQGRKYLATFGFGISLVSLILGSFTGVIFGAILIIPITLNIIGRIVKRDIVFTGLNSRLAGYLGLTLALTALGGIVFSNLLNWQLGNFFALNALLIGLLGTYHTPVKVALDWAVTRIVPQEIPVGVGEDIVKTGIIAENKDGTYISQPGYVAPEQRSAFIYTVRFTSYGALDSSFNSIDYTIRNNQAENLIYTVNSGTPVWEEIKPPKDAPEINKEVNVEELQGKGVDIIDNTKGDFSFGKLFWSHIDPVTNCMPEAFMKKIFTVIEYKDGKARVVAYIRPHPIAQMELVREQELRAKYPNVKIYHFARAIIMGDNSKTPWRTDQTTDQFKSGAYTYQYELWRGEEYANLYEYLRYSSSATPDIGKGKFDAIIGASGDNIEQMRENAYTEFGLGRDAYGRLRVVDESRTIKNAIISDADTRWRANSALGLIRVAAHPANERFALIQ
ncbi:MAG: DUF3131 domain-containing protein, partial [Candidatus Omnitrophica bacterium]|nr:DUF3131 domain-containing protein [Candidatus Omnitrophota bacterium]